ncbi:hypothetical protein J4Q44_G00028600 [Coregonus suidteri]|uniref:Uncharacterized protein n=1 Tax=Coregonus suidteri TaxID=861788 RepID=A0AAN8R500_9TELE
MEQERPSFLPSVLTLRRQVSVCRENMFDQVETSPSSCWTTNYTNEAEDTKFGPDMAELRCRKTAVKEGEEEEHQQCESEPRSENFTMDKVSLKKCSEDTDGATCGAQEKEKEDEEEEEKKEEDEKEEADSQKPSPVKRTRSACRSVMLQSLVKLFFGCLAAVTCGMMYAVYLYTYHERKFWFSSRQELEREITFQGGSGLYYYYYKHMLTAPSFERGIYELMRDNRTVSGQTINAVERLSLYPELVTSLLYRVTGSQDVIEPVYFYLRGGVWPPGCLRHCPLRVQLGDEWHVRGWHTGCGLVCHQPARHKQSGLCHSSAGQLGLALFLLPSCSFNRIPE